ncbi:MAG: hypothetical protein DRJ14_03555, partial [Acidobacteria bacterium]
MKLRNCIPLFMKPRLLRSPGNERENRDRAKRGLATPRCLSPALRPSQLSARYAWAEEKEVGVGVGVGVRKIRELAIP